jgi:kumamolisin
MANPESVPAGYQRVAGSERFRVPGAVSVGPADPTETAMLTIRVRRRADAPALPDMEELAANAPGARSYPTPEEFAATYGADPADLDAVAAFAAANGLEVTERSIPRRSVFVTGTIGRLADAFKVELSRYNSPRGAYRGREGHVHVPEELSDIVVGVFGLDNRGMARRASNGGQLNPFPNPVPLSPQQVASFYQFPDGITAAGQTIGLLEFWDPGPAGYRDSDIKTFFEVNGLPEPTITVVSLDGASNLPARLFGSSPEITLDIDVAGAAAPGADIVVYLAPWTEQGWHDIVTAAVADAVNNPVVLSMSYGWAELENDGLIAWTQQAIDAVNETFGDAANMGITLLASSGDDGTNCHISDGRAHVLFPASSPWVTACGGTTIKSTWVVPRDPVDAPPPARTAGSNAGPFFTETVWNSWWAPDGIYAATGGGVSDIFGPQSWQNVSGVTIDTSVNDQHKGRGVPDIAGNADPNSGYTIYFFGQQNLTGGTSATAPLYAGLVALLAAWLGRRPGWLNPYLYGLVPQGLWPYVFNDITGGGANNGTNAIIGENSTGYPARVGWDACTGLGSINGVHLLSALQQPHGRTRIPISWGSLITAAAVAGVAASQDGYAVLPGGFRIPVDHMPEPFDLIGAQDLLAGLLLRRIAASISASESRHEIDALIDAAIDKAAKRVGYSLPRKD